MDLCSDGHDEVAYEGRGCPVCEIIEEKYNEIEDLNETIGGLEGAIEVLEEEPEPVIHICQICMKEESK